jgi:cardiolipin synthase
MWWAVSLVAVVDVVVIARAVSRGYGVENTIAWVMAILALPVVGALGYMTLASPSLKRTTRRKRLRNLPVRSKASTRDWTTAGGASASRGRASEIGPPDSTGATVLHMASALTGLDSWRGNEVTLLVDADDAVGQMRAALIGAQRSIWIEFYIIKNDATGARFLDRLAERARDGLEVRLLYDALGSIGIDARRLEALRAAGGRVEAFLPFNPLRRRWAINLRNHRKLVVVDGEIGFTGGMNVGDEYSGRLGSRLTRQVKDQLQRIGAGVGSGAGSGAVGSGGAGAADPERREAPPEESQADTFRDTHLKIVGPAVADLAQIFAEDWSFATDEELTLPPPPPPCPEGEVVAIVPSGPDQEHNSSGLVYFSGVATARQRAWLTSAYFVPDHAMIAALVSAALRGVDVRVLVPQRSDVALVDAAARSNFLVLLRGGVRIFLYQPSVLHAKTMVVDGAWGMVGSANFDIRSFRLNFELGALVLGPHFADRMEARFKRDLEHSREVLAPELEARGFLERLRDGGARLVSPLL